MNASEDIVIGYRAKVVHVVDGNGLDIEMELGCGSTLLVQCRLDGVEAPGLDDPDPEERRVAWLAKDFVEVLVRGKEVRVDILKDRVGKHGRWPAVVFWRDAAGTWWNLNADLVENGLAAAVPPSQEESAGYDRNAPEAIA